MEMPLRLLTKASCRQTVSRFLEELWARENCILYNEMFGFLGSSGRFKPLDLINFGADLPRSIIFQDYSLIGQLLEERIVGLYEHLLFNPPKLSSARSSTSFESTGTERRQGITAS